eukprot:TRINITY_DN6304_c0_g1_i1.p2 TRINITY_DN6304_c0_g1~~TRINITY_DN6304_c0_g1_i1.p2  ORF type:complete len:103 (+),score=8.99 TRINITY_DN6304_c0_g1_i1:181-489(+)
MGCGSSAATNPQEAELREAAIDGDVSKIRELVTSGVDVNSTGDMVSKKTLRRTTYMTPLAHAAREGKEASVMALIDAGADIQRTDVASLTYVLFSILRCTLL